MSFAISRADEKFFPANLREKFLKFRNRQKLSSQISLTYAIILATTIILTNAGTTAGVYYLFHHQAARALDISIERTTKKAVELQTVDESFFSLGTIMPSVFYRVTDSSGNKIIDSSPTLPATERILKYVREDPPFWSDENYQLIETPHSFFYYRDLPLEVGGQIFHFQLFKTITFEKQFIQYLLITLVVVNIGGLILALIFGNVLSKKILQPLRQVTLAAGEISAGNLNKRIAIEKSCDEVNELSDSFNKMLERLEESFTRQKRFIADASHEFRTPITIIKSYAEVLENYGTETELREESTTAIKNSAEGMQSLIEKLLFLARADEGNQPIKKIPVELNEILKSTIKNNSRVDFSGSENFNFIGDPEFLKKMFGEFLNNAMSYSTEKISVEVHEEKNFASVKIIDRGIGISYENREKIFDRFFRADKSRTKSDDEKISAGLGLSIAKWIADQHNIKIKVQSELGHGSIFELIFERI